ncbi:MAG: helix-turn-helix transcriptional regulator [Ktedonobacteraceae bacterium]|nr:helix-turn-helix transcriptional regulator [Ktedonobacteraceae bacterium]
MVNSRSLTSGGAAERAVPRRPAEVDKYVDTFLSAVCDTSRRYILELLTIPEEDDPIEMPERRSGDIARAIGLSAATTSEHLRQLSKIGVVRSRRDGNVIYYRLRDKGVVKAFQDLLSALDSDYAQWLAKHDDN